MNIKSAIRNGFLSYGPTLLGRRKFSRVCESLGKQPELDLSLTREWHLAANSKARLVSSRELVPALFSAYYDNADVSQIVPDESVASASSYVPYCRGHTSLLVFNFFKANYGIRDPVLYRLSIWKDRDVTWTQQFLLAGDGVTFVEDPSGASDSLPKNGNLLLEAFHPRISTPAFQLRYFAFYQDENAGLVSGVHSIPAKSAAGIYALGQPSYRAFGVSDATHFYYHAVASPTRLLPISGSGPLHKLRSEHAVPLSGYIIAETGGGCPSSIWHDGTTPLHLKNAQSPREVGRTYSSFYVPDFKKHAPRVLISSAQLGFQPKIVRIRLVADNSKNIAEKELAVTHDDATIDMAQEFSSYSIEDGVTVLFEFDRDIGEFQGLPGGMMHLYFRSPNGTGDQAASYNTLGYHDDPFRRNKSYRCRKFAPFLNNPRLDFIYSVVNFGGNGKILGDTFIRIRVLTDCGSEYVTEKELSPVGVTNFRAIDILRSAAIRIRRSAIFQIEHETINFAASWYAVDRESGHLAVDHFTGG